MRASERYSFAWRNGMPVRLEQLGRVMDGVENDKLIAWFNGERGVILRCAVAYDSALDDRHSVARSSHYSLDEDPTGRAARPCACLRMA